MQAAPARFEAYANNLLLSGSRLFARAIGDLYH